MTDRASADRLAMLAALEKKILWLASWTIHNANHLRDSRDGLKVGGHQASSASLATIMTALYFAVAEARGPGGGEAACQPDLPRHPVPDRTARRREKLETFRGYKGAQSLSLAHQGHRTTSISPPARWASASPRRCSPPWRRTMCAPTAGGWTGPRGGMVALIGDAEMDEGNIYEALIEGWKHGLRNTWWVVDYNRQSLDAVVREGLWERFEAMFRNFGWDVVILKYGKLLEAAFAEPGGEALRRWIDSCPNQLYAALCYQGGAAWRTPPPRRPRRPGRGDGAPRAAAATRELARLMTNLAGPRHAPR